MEKKRRKIILAIFAGLITGNVLAWLAVYQLNCNSLEVIFFDVGQGDASLIKTPQGHLILIDGGPDSVILEKLGEAMPFWDKTIDLVILTHPHYDHLSGLNHVLEKYQVESVLWTGVTTETASFNWWKELIGLPDGPEEYLAEAGQKISAGSAVLEILYPLAGTATSNDLDNSSIVIRLSFGQNSFLFTGDAFVSVEKELVEKELEIDSDVLQVGHHGSDTSTDESFLQEVSPSLAVISVGKENSYGHPHQKILNLLEGYGIVVLRTDVEGDIKIISNGKKIHAISTF